MVPRYDQKGRLRDVPRQNSFTPGVRKAILEADGYMCRECEDTERLRVDHIIPVYRGGEGTFENGQTLCHRCHVRKHYYEKKITSDGTGFLRRYRSVE